MRALVTGSHGYIGKILCKFLVQEKWKVRAVDIRHNYSYAGMFPNDYDVDVIFHLGAHSLLGPSVADPLPYFHNNVNGLVNMIHDGLYRSTTQPLPPIIFASSAAVYGDLDKSMPYSESEAGNPINPYGLTKWMGEQILRETCRAYGHKAYAMRFFNVAGAWEGLGQDIDQPHILTKMCLASLTGEKFIINGFNYNTYDGTCVRDYIHVYDVCRALEAAAHKLIAADKHTFDAYNVGRGIEGSTSNKRLMTRFVGQHYPIDWGYGAMRPGDPGYLMSNPTKLRDDIYTPTIDFPEIIETQYQYVKEQLRNGSYRPL